jgi:uncharacterized membrane protein YeaQ/YmgE (transglycosylase-associated protein family)
VPRNGSLGLVLGQFATHRPVANVVVLLFHTLQDSSVVRPDKRTSDSCFTEDWISPLKGQGEKDMNWVALIIQLISGAVGGNIAGALLKKFDLGPVGNSIAGLIGGGIGGQLLGMLTAGGAASSAMSAATSAAGSGLDLSSILSSVGGGGIGGAVVMAVVGLIKGQMAKS